MRLLVVVLDFRRNILDLEHQRVFFISLKLCVLDSYKLILTDDFESISIQIVFPELQKQIKNTEFSFHTLGSSLGIKLSFLIALLVNTDYLLVQNLSWIFVGFNLIFFLFDTNQLKNAELNPFNIIDDYIGNRLLLVLAQVQLLDLVLKVHEHKLELIQELVVHVLSFVVTNDNDALIWVIKNVLENGLSLNNIINVVLKIVDAVIEEMTDNWETNYKWQIIDQLILHSNCLPFTLRSDEQP